VEPGASDRIEGFSCFEFLTVASERDSDAMVDAAIVKSGLLACIEEDITVSLFLTNARARIVSRAKVMDGP
jgi:hypothetical protein